MKKNIYIILILVNICLFTACRERISPTKEDKQIMANLGEFPYYKMKKWEQANNGNRIRFLYQNTDTIIGYIDAQYSFREYQPTTHCPLFVMCVEDPVSEETTYTVNMSLVANSDTLAWGYRWCCYRNEYKILFAQSIYSSRPLIYDFTDKVEKYDYNAMFDLLPDTIILEEGPITTTLVANTGVTKVENRWTGEKWEVIK